jgi:hypothetical protein
LRVQSLETVGHDVRLEAVSQDQADCTHRDRVEYGEQANLGWPL